MRKFSAFLYLTASVSLSLSTISGAEAKIGQNIDAYKSKVSAAYKLKTTTAKQDRTYYVFTLNPSANLAQKAPGFSAGLTATVVDKKILGQSMIVRFGDNYQSGKEMAAYYAMDFVYESLGKSPPGNPDSARSELSQFAGAIEQVLAGVAQHVQYPGFPVMITMTRTQTGEILLAATPNMSGSDSKKK